MNKRRIAIIGHGFVGQAVEYVFSTPSVEQMIIDTKYTFGNTINDLAGFNPDFTFVCVPTPMSDDGKINASIVNQVITQVLETVGDKSYVVLKSTLTPEHVSKITDYRFIYNPEFLAERSAKADIVNPQFHVIGSNDNAAGMQLSMLYKKYSMCGHVPTFYMKPIDASYVKYGINCFLATKVSFFNELFANVINNNADWVAISTAITSDERIGDSHSKVPGFDGKMGFGGACFPKDVSAFINACDDLTILEQAMNSNNSVRQWYDRDQREVEQNIQFDKPVVKFDNNTGEK